MTYKKFCDFHGCDREIKEGEGGRDIEWFCGRECLESRCLCRKHFELVEAFIDGE